MTRFATILTAPASTSWDRALTKYASTPKNRRPPSGKRIGQSAYAADSHVTITYAMLDGVMMRIETSRKWGVVTTPCKAQPCEEKI
mgnify:CR=1 FL=1|jgi:hypothetical protein